MIIYDNLPSFFHEYKSFLYANRLTIVYGVILVISVAIAGKMISVLKWRLRGRKKYDDQFYASWITKKEFQEILMKSQPVEGKSGIS